MKTLFILGPALALAIAADPLAVEPPDQETGLRLAVTCPKIKEEFTGRRRICYYNCLGTTRALSVRAEGDCPASIER